MKTVDLKQSVDETLMSQSESDGTAGPLLSVAEIIGKLDLDLTITAGQLDARNFSDQSQDMGSIGRFSLRGELGRGGMGRVLHAWDPELGRSVAVKLVIDHRRVRPSQLARFVSEARITSQLQHPNIVPVHDMGITTDGEIFFVMKLVEGRSLDALLDQLKSGSEALRNEWGRHRLLSLFVRVCNAVAYAHSHGVLHRDIKPANVMIGEFGEVLLMDWGLARVGSGIEPASTGVTEDSESSDGYSMVSASGVRSIKTLDGVLIGTPGYMSPEQARGEFSSLDARCDVWSLGAMMFELLTHQRAVPRERLLSYALGTIDIDPRDRAPDLEIPDDLAGICTKAMAHDREQRYPSVVDLTRDIEGFLDGARRREQALERITQGREFRSKATDARRRAEQLRAQASEQLAGVADHEPEHKKIPGWIMIEEAQNLEIEAELDETRFVQAIRGSLEGAPELGVAHSLLTDYYKSQHEAAEAAGDRRGAARIELYLREHDRGQYAEYLRGEGKLTLVTEPTDATVKLHRYEVSGKRLQLTQVDELPASQLRERSLAMGSYLLEISAPERRTTRYPVLIQRLGCWTGVRPGDTEPSPIVLPKHDEIGDDDVYIPAGFYQSGGDPTAVGSLPGRRIWVDALVMRRFAVTHGEWLVYLNDLLDRDMEREALQRVPRESAGELLYDRSEAGRFCLRPVEAGGAWRERHPVCNVEWADANAYARWYAERTGRPWRLPSELEWEKAARGVDGRSLPWGDHHDPSWCVTVESHADAPALALIDSYPIDESPYGVRGLAGGVRDWCIDEFAPEGPAVEAGVLAAIASTDELGTHITRGGAWCLPSWVSRAACRGYHAPIRLRDLGLRLVCAFGPTPT
jgi:serine/threonine protein kinase/formylglycine-generating enzyme required for sulfatase activity